MSDVTTEPCVCAHSDSKNHVGDTFTQAKPQEGGVCLYSYTRQAVCNSGCCCIVVSQSNVSCCKRSDNPTLDLTLQDRVVVRGVSA